MSVRGIEKRPATERRSDSAPVAGCDPRSPGTAAGVEPGQTWKDCDPRQSTTDGTRLLIVERIDNYDRAVCRVVWEVEGRGRRAGRLVHIRLDRFRPRRNGYQLVYDPRAGTDGAGGGPAS